LCSIVAFAVVVLVATGTADAQRSSDSSMTVSLDSALCAPPMKMRAGLPDYDVWDLADGLVRRGKYKDAARGYYQVFRCDNWSPINPVVSDYHFLGPFDLALRKAAEGHFADAVQRLKLITAGLDDFGEARFLTGIYQWALGERAQARQTWRATLTAPYFTLPPDAEYTPRCVTDARAFLKWSGDQPAHH
jgi:hypothetical protein